MLVMTKTYESFSYGWVGDSMRLIIIPYILSYILCLYTFILYCPSFMCIATVFIPPYTKLQSIIMIIINIIISYRHFFVCIYNDHIDSAYYYWPQKKRIFYYLQHHHSSVPITSQHIGFFNHRHQHETIHPHRWNQPWPWQTKLTTAYGPPMNWCTVAVAPIPIIPQPPRPPDRQPARQQVGDSRRENWRGKRKPTPWNGVYLAIWRKGRLLLLWVLFFV